MVGGITHGYHPFRKIWELFRKQIVFQEIIFHKMVSGQIHFHPCGKKAVTQPAGPFSGRAVHVKIGGILCKGFPACLKNPVKGIVAG